MRIAVAGDGSRGDIQPLIVLGESWARLGHQVTLFAPPDFAGLARGRALDYRPHGPSVRVLLGREASALRGGPLRFFGAARRYCAEALERQFERVEAIRGYDLLVGGGVALAGPSIAECRGIPYRYVAYTPALLESAQHPGPGVRRQDLPACVNRATWRLFKGVYGAFLRAETNRFRRDLGLSPVRDAYRHFVTETPWMATDPALAPAPADAPFETRHAGFPFDTREEPLPEKLEAFLDSGSTPVYIGFGSMPDVDPAATTREVVRGVERAGCRAVLSRGWAGLGEGPLSEHVFVTDDVCHARLFPRVAAVVHHGGAGTTSAAARAGVPQVVVPHAVDQFYWAHRALVSGLSPGSLPRRGLRADRLALLLREALENEWLATRTREFGRQLRAGEAAWRDARAAMLG